MPLSKNVTLDGRTSDKEQYDHSMQMHPTVFCFAASPLRQKISAAKAPHLYFHLRVFCMVCLYRWIIPSAEEALCPLLCHQQALEVMR
jgi:hypothetical protein